VRQLCRSSIGPLAGCRLGQVQGPADSDIVSPLAKMSTEPEAVSRDRRNIVCDDMGGVDHVGVSQCGSSDVVVGS